jgi:hypothetical protein
LFVYPKRPTMTTTSPRRFDYIPDESESHNGNGNGHANGNGKIFTLKPATDPDTLAILHSRDAALSDRRLNRSMGAFYAFILDRSLNPAYFDCKGIVAVSDTVVADYFGVSPRSVYDWKRGVEAAGYVWLSQKWKSNMWPITTYHISALHKKRADKKTDADGTYGGSKFRSAPVSPGLGARRPGQPGLPLPGSRQLPPDPKSELLQPIAALSGEEVRLSPAENFGSEPQNSSALSRSQLRRRAAELRVRMVLPAGPGRCLPASP